MTNLMLSNSRTRFIRSLKLKKHRQKEQLFTAEGTKNVLELVQSDFEVESIYGTTSFIKENKVRLERARNIVHEIPAKHLTSLSNFKTNTTALAVAKMKPNVEPDRQRGQFQLALDGIGDPGNLGTIIRIADWYGIRGIVASEDSVDLYNPKVIAASMGSFTRVPVYFTDLESYFDGLENGHNIFGAFLEGENVHQASFIGGGTILLGSESHGIGKTLKKRVTKRVTIPRYGGAESLNVSAAAAVICDNIRRHDMVI